MSDLSSISKDELLRLSEEQYAVYEHHFSKLSEDELTKLKDDAGWSVKDHLYHLALAEGGMIALLDGKPIYENLGVDVESYKQGDDVVNAITQKRYRDLPLKEVLDTLKHNHQQLMEKIRATDEAELLRPFNEFQPENTPREGSVLLALSYNTFHHYEEHAPWIVEILNGKPSRMPKAELIKRMEAGFENINKYLDSLSEAQLTEPTDAAGWTAKDHVIHMAVWEESILALLSGTAQWIYMKIDKDIWKQGEDPINAVIQQRYKDMTLGDVRRVFRENHQQVMEKLQNMSDEDLQRPYNHYQPMSKQDRPIILWIQGNTYQHYEAHRPWIEAIVGKHSS